VNEHPLGYALITLGFNTRLTAVPLS